MILKILHDIFKINSIAQLSWCS